MAILERAALIAGLLIACGSPSIEDGTITCGPGGSCPDDFRCAWNDLCYRDQPPDAPTRDGQVDDAPPVALDCMSYCNAIDARCVGANRQYGSVATCLASCSHFPVGAAIDTTGNTLGCRAYQTGRAASDPVASCVLAGPSGGGTCGTPCNGFCTIVVPVCPTEYTAGQCPTDCAQLPMSPPYSATVQSGDSLTCRLYYATAATTDAATFCPATSATGSTTCQ